MPSQEVVQVIVRPVGDRQHQTKLHERPDDGRPQPANAERSHDGRVERDVGLDDPAPVSPRCCLGHVAQGLAPAPPDSHRGLLSMTQPRAFSMTLRAA